jgi:tetratricopeptide (TPR) repeat protein
MAGDDALAAGEWNIAIEHYRRAAKLDARSPLAQVRLGDAFRRQNADPTAPLRADESRALLDNAVRAYERSLVLNPLDSGVWFRLAVVREGQNEIELARAAYERAVTLDPLNPALLLRAGRFDVRTGLLVRGTELLERSAKLGNAAAKEALAKLRAQKPATPAR